MDRYLNNFQEHIFGILTLRKCQTLLQNYGFLITKELIFGFQILDLKCLCIEIFDNFLIG